MDYFSIIFFSGSIFYSFITGSILLLRNQDQVFTSRLLGLIILTVGWFAMMYLVTSSNLLVYIPYVYRIGSPLYYLIPPCCYLYVRSLVNGETSFRKNDWPHFILPVLNLIDLLPYYFSSAEHKRQIVDIVAQNIRMNAVVSTGLLPDITHFILRPLQGAVYLVLQWGLVYITLKSRKSRVQRFEHGGYWLVTFTFLETLMYAGMAFVSLHGFQYNTTSTHITAVLLFSGFLILSLHLFINPELLYGMQIISGSKVYPKTIPEEPEKKNYSSNKKQLTAEYITSFADRIERYMQEKELFRQQGISVYELASALGLPSSNLSFILNRHYGQRFNDFINTCRVNYVIERFKEENWKELTMEALAYEAGFSSRSVFFTSFKKSTGLNPTEYIAQSKQKKI
jgi:AraC-like DNA-binding protein